MTAPVNDPQKLLIVDCDGNPLYHLIWHQGQYVPMPPSVAVSITSMLPAPGATLAQKDVPVPLQDAETSASQQIVTPSAPAPPGLRPSAPSLPTLPPGHPPINAALQELVLGLQTACDEIEQVVVVTPDGRLLAASVMPQPEALGTLAVQLRQVMAQADASLDLGGMQDIVLRSSSQLCVLYPIAPMATLVVTCQTDKTLGMVHWACRDAVERIEAILRQEEAG